MAFAMPADTDELVADFSAVRNEIFREAEKAWGREACGFIYEADGCLRLRPVPNSASLDTEFFIHPRDQYRALCEIELAGGIIRAIYHSHPNGLPTPSERDRAFAKLWPGVAMVIANQTAIRAYTPSGEEIWGC